MHLQFESFYKISTSSLKGIGAHPQTDKNYKWAIRFLLMHGYYTICFILFAYNMIFIDIKEQNDYIKASSHGVFCVVYVVVSFFYLVLIWFQADINAVIKEQQKYFDSSKDLPEEDQKIIYNYASKGRLVSKLWMVSTLVAMGMFPLNGGIMSVYSIYKGNLILYPFANDVYPPSIDSIKQRFDIFVILYVMHIIYAMYTVFMYTGFSPLEPIFIYNICAQIEILTKKVNVIFGKPKQFNRQETEGKIKMISQIMLEIYSSVELVNKVFKVVNELCLKASAVLIPVAIFVIIKVLDRGELGLDYIMFVYTALILCFVPCYCSELLKEKNEKLRIALYSSGWENFFDRSTRSSLLFLLTRATKPVSIRSVFDVMCLDRFTDLCRQSYTLFNVMNAGLN